LKKIILLLAISFLLINLGNQSFAESDKLVVLETNLGTIVIEFFFDDAPNHVDNFINLTESGFYDGTLFHRIIPGFMIQGGDPNTINGDPNTWGQGGPNETVNAEFNSIQHNRGIVSMARSTDPNSAGSQFFIVHQNSNFLDEEYTVFGRIVTESSFETLDKITAVQTGTSDRPINPEQVRISKVTVVERSNISNILKLSEPERTGSIVTNMPEFAVFENQELDVKFTVPVGWLLQQPQKSSEDAPDVVAVGPKVDGINPYISLTVKDVKGKTIDDLITAKNNILEQAVYQNQLEILSQEKVEENIYQTEAIGDFVVDDTSLKIKFIETMILINEKLYTFAYSNTVDNFDNELSKFNESLDSFKILSQEIPEEPVTENGGGCLIATATYGSEMALEVQQLRELRDNILLQTESGTNFMNTFNDIYYSFSPVISDYERENPVFKEVVKLAITPMISSLSILNYVDMDSESEVLGYGISLILLNVGIYLGIPAVVIIGIKKKF
jgi:peptidyl-prolyl cis-trans isomerase B (cyclophilin B)